MTGHAFAMQVCGSVDAPAGQVFAFLDNQENLAFHMSRPSGMMLGTRMQIHMDADGTQRVGARFGFTGRILGLPLRVDEIVTDRTPPLAKAWETRAEPTLWVIGRYRMGFDLVERGARADLCIHIAYDWAPGALGALLGRLFGRLYAGWCIRRMLRDAIGHFQPHTRAPA